MRPPLSFPLCRSSSSGHARRLVWGIVAFLFATPGLFAQATVSERIDKIIRDKTPGYDAKASAIANDDEFLRRIYLDLTGITPSASAARAFLKDADPKRREKLVDKLLASDESARHLMHTFDVLLMDRRPSVAVKDQEWREYLRTSFVASRPYDQMVSEILRSDGVDAKTRPAARFILDRKAETNLVTKDVGRVFLGMNLTCCQCHDHPQIDAYKQEHYYGIYAFLNRTVVQTDKATKKTVLVEKADGDVSFQSVFEPKVSKMTGPRLPGGKELEEPKGTKPKVSAKSEAKVESKAPARKDAKVVAKVEAKKESAKANATSKVSRREVLAKTIVEHPQFARSTANRVWHMLTGRGVVHPVEQDHVDNPPSHPELLDLLAKEFVAQKHDLKKLIRSIVLSQTYQRSSAVKADGKAPAAAEFATAELRPLTPEQFAWSILQATGQIDAERGAMGAKANEAALYGKLAPLAQRVIALHAGLAGEPAISQDFEATLDQALFLKNGSTIQEWLAPRKGSLVERTVKIKDGGEAAEELFLSVLSRRPSREESDEVARLLSAAGADRTRAVQDIAWGLLTSAEFRFNH